MNPSQTEIAATLARNSSDSPATLVARALALYHEAGKALAPPPPHPNEPDAEDDRQPEIPTPKAYPVKFDDALRLWMPTYKGRTAERAARFRLYLRESMRVDLWNRRGCTGPLAKVPEPSKADVDALFAKKRKTGYSPFTYPEAAADFLRWQKRYVKAAHAEAAKRGPKKAS